MYCFARFTAVVAAVSRIFKKDHFLTDQLSKIVRSFGNHSRVTIRPRLLPSRPPLPLPGKRHTGNNTGNAPTYAHSSAPKPGRQARPGLASQFFLLL